MAFSLIEYAFEHLIEKAYFYSLEKGTKKIFAEKRWENEGGSKKRGTLVENISNLSGEYKQPYQDLLLKLNI